MNQAIIDCKKITKYFGQGSSRIAALTDVNLRIDRGELRLLMGPSGSGKTTLISVIAGMLTQDEGQCLVNGIDLNHLADKQRVYYRGKNIGFVFQAFNLVPSLTCEENIAVPLLAFGTPRKEALEKAEELLISFGLKEKIGAMPPSLSGGQQQRIAIARAIIHQPPIIVCDEPTSFLDHHTGLMIMEILKKMTIEKHVTIIVVTHDPRIVQFADKIDKLEDGRIVSG
jgi:putative ABC transport system ATP-binding protein